MNTIPFRKRSADRTEDVHEGRKMMERENVSNSTASEIRPKGAELIEKARERTRKELAKQKVKLTTGSRVYPALVAMGILGTISVDAGALDRLADVAGPGTLDGYDGGSKPPAPPNP